MAAKKPAKKAMPAKKKNSSGKDDERTVPFTMYLDASNPKMKTGEMRTTRKNARNNLGPDPKGKILTSVDMYTTGAVGRYSGEYAKGAKKGSMTGKAKKKK
jgi:hypothetical protein